MKYKTYLDLKSNNTYLQKMFVLKEDLDFHNRFDSVEKQQTNAVKLGRRSQRFVTVRISNLLTRG